MNRINHKIKLLGAFVLFTFFFQCTSSKSKSAAVETSNTLTEFKIKPSETDGTIKTADIPSRVMYNPQIPQGKLLLFLPGTFGIAERGPNKLFMTAIEQGYRVINLSYINEQAVARICKDENLENDANCTEKFRTQRVFGTTMTSLIPDEPQDAILNRFTKLLLYLDKTDKAGKWKTYLNGNEPNWSIITVAGQSQGGGMAAFIAKKVRVDKIISFSGGWDFSEKGKIAHWYSNESVTPPDRWYGIYHIQEPRAAVIPKTYRAMAIPENHIYLLDLPVPEGRKAHTQGVGNTAYKEMWIDIFGDGSLKAN